jgi:Tfp pilus assembly protein PilN
VIVSTSLGVSVQGEVLRLALASRRFSRVKVLGLLTVNDFRQRPAADVRKEVSDFLKGKKADALRCVLAVPRHEVIVRQIELPKEAEANLAKVVEYQLVNLLPLEDAAICYDYCVAKHGAESKTLQITIFLVLKPIVEQHIKSCEGLGLKVDRIIPTSVGLANYFLMSHHYVKTSNALIGYWADRRCEVLGLLNRGFSFSREFRLTDGESRSEMIKREGEFFRGQARLREDTVLDVFISGQTQDMEPVDGGELGIEDKRFKIRHLAQPQVLGAEAQRTAFRGNKVQDHLLALASALSGLKKTVPVSVNLLPPEKRVQRSGRALVPTYVLLAINLALALLLILRKPIQQQAFSSQLSREATRLEPEVKKTRAVEKQITDLQRRTDLLAGFKKSNSTALDVLNELSKILPKNTWVFDLNMKNQAVDIYGASEAAAALPQILDNSPYFKEAEFIGSITKDGSGKEIYRIRMKMESGQPQVAVPQLRPKK